MATGASKGGLRYAWLKSSYVLGMLSDAVSRRGLPGPGPEVQLQVSPLYKTMMDLWHRPLTTTIFMAGTGAGDPAVAP
jgi:hypothetical protein